MSSVQIITSSTKDRVESNIEVLLDESPLSEPDAVIAKMKSFLEFMQEFNPKDKDEKERFETEYSQLYATSLVALVNRLDKSPKGELYELTYSHFRNEILRYAQLDIRFELVEVVSHFKGVFEYTLRTVTANKEIVLRAVAFVKNDKIIRIERRNTTVKNIPKPVPKKVEKEIPAEDPVFTAPVTIKKTSPPPKKVSGQVEASNKVFVRGFPTEAEIAKKVVKRPKRTNRKLLCEGTDLEPAEEAGQIVKLVLSHDKDGLIGRRGHITIETSEKEMYAGGAAIEEYHRPINQKCFVLKDKDGNPIALCMQDRIKLDHTYTIYGTKPLNEGDKWETKQGDTKMYPWYRVFSYYRDLTERRCISYWNGKSFKAIMVATHHTTKDNNYSDRVTEHKGEILITSTDGKKTYGLLTRKATGSNTSAWTVAAAPGADPALMICVSAVIEDYIGLYFV